ncbi:MAG TPA: right-handed parallel beta-helix repeat-containing protein, partial [Candidatus Krumholzibacteria bacterium]|nr:right-handed parallel beta-helix repeat-containing protein [Candidatus Krumholzibacteria bacterium]
ILFPNRFDQNNFVRANQEVRIPREGYSLQVENWRGTEYVQIVACNVQFVTCSNSTFNHNNMKGLYAEKLSDATFTGCTVSGNGFDPAGIPSYFLPWMSGVDVNLKAGTYQNLVFSGCTVTSNGLGGAQHGVGLTAKARGTGTLDTGYAAYPATLDNVQVIDCIVTGNERGIRFGEPGKDNTTPTNVVVSGCTLAGNVQTYAGSDGSAYGDVVNVSTAPVNAGFNWWGDTDATDQVGGTGAVAISPWLGAAPGTSPMAWYVDTTGTIQAAIDAAVAGDDIYVSAGHFEEQLHVTKDDLAITGAGAGATFVDCPPVLALAYTTSVANKPVVFVDGCTGVALSGLTVDGLGRGNANYRFQGIGFWNAGGSVTNAHVTNIMDTPFSGSQHGVGIYAYNVTGGPYTIAVTDVLVDAFQKGGVVVNGAGEHGIFTRVTTPGAGPTGVTAQNGIQVGYGATGAVIDCTVSDVVYTGSNWGATGVLIYDAGPVTVSGTNIDASQAAISYSYGGGSVTGGALTGCTTVGVELWNSYAKADAGRIRPAPVAEDAHRADKAAQSVTITNVPMTANGGTAGVWVTADDPAAVSVTGSSITGFEYGMILDEVLPGAIGGSATGNVIAANTNFGAWSNTATPFDARGNDWGTASGPFHATLNPAGQGNAVSDNVLFEPWTGQAGLSVSPVATGPLSCGQSVDLTFSYTADASTPDMFLYNIVVAIPAELTYAGSTDDEPFGDSNKYFYDIDNGDGTRTITGSTVGNPTNPVSGAGTVPLFTLHLTTAGDGTASVGAQSFVFRDPTNQPIAAGASGATVTVDCTAPAAVTAIAAAPGHNKIDLTWSHDGNDVDHYEVFAGLWHDGAHASAYPEYDDMPADALPVREGSYAATAASADWLSVGTPGTPGFTQAWTDALNRGVYYYEVFAIDAAGNASPASASIDRATNYWLGDVYGLTDATPNGVVNAFDVNELGSAFGTAVPYGAATNVMDVGPTDDWSRLGVPLTDNVINFEDLIIFTMNFGVVSAAKDRAPMDDHVALSWVDYGDGRYGLRLVDGASLKGLRVQAPGAVDNVTAGALLDEQSELTFLRNVGATLDASVAVFGGGVAFTGSGDLMVIEAGDAIDVADLVITARATDNSALTVTVDKTSDAMAPRVFALHPNYPNPFNPTTKISFSLPEAQSVRLAIYSVDGRRVATLVNEVRTAGLHEVLWKGQDDAGRPMASGVYFCRIDAGPYSSVHKMMLAK